MHGAKPGKLPNSASSVGSEISAEEGLSGGDLGRRGCVLSLQSRPSPFPHYHPGAQAGPRGGH